MRPARLTAVLALATAALVVPAAAQAAIPSVFGGEVGCAVQADGIRFCGSSSPRSTTKTFDGVPIDVNVAFPAEPAAGGDGDYPLVMLFHGYGGGKLGLSTMQRWLDRGYATFSMTDRGFRESCGSADSRAADPSGCERGYVRLIDTRYEVRDAQVLAGRLVDEGLVDPQKLAAIGGSYGGALSLALAALKDRTMMPDGDLVAWKSPNGTAMKLAAAAPSVTWSDLAYSLAPNGSTLDYLADSPYRGRFGVMKESLVNGLYISGQAAPGFYAPEGSDPSADLTRWRNLLLAGEPYDGVPEAQAILDEITAYHSAYYIDDSTKPAPILYSNGFTDDLFPVDEAVRFYNRTRTEYPKADISLVLGEVAGHPRSTSKSNVNDVLRAREVVWFDHFVKGEGKAPVEGVTAFTQTCPGTEPGGGPYKARNWARIAPGEISLDFGKAKKTIAATAGDQAIAATFDPVTGGGSCAQASGADQPGTATYRLDPAPSGGYTLLGSPTVTAQFGFSGNTSQVAARLLDVGPDGQETLVARGLWRPKKSKFTQVFQLHPNGWHFDQGHVAKLELLPADDGNGAIGGYGRASNDQQDVTVSGLVLSLPVVEKPGALDGLVMAHAPPLVVPEGYDLARDFRREPSAKLTRDALEAIGDTVVATVKCPGSFATCKAGKITLQAEKKSHSYIAARGGFELKGGQKKAVQLDLATGARAYLRDHARLRVIAATTSAETRSVAVQSRKLVAG